MKFNNAKIALGVLLILAIVWFVAARSRPLEKYREVKEIGSVPITIDVCVEKGVDIKKTARVLEDVWQKNRDIYTRMSNYIDDSDIGKINRSYQNPQKVGEDTIRVFDKALQYKKKTRGVFDITVRSFMDLWSKCQNENRLPTQQELADAKAAARLSNVKVLLGNRIEILNPRTKVDYGGIATGFAIDEVVKILHKRGIKNFLIDAGGDMYASGSNCGRKPWTIAIRNPEDRTKIVDVIQVSGLSVSTSGGFEKFYSINGQKFSHIINPMTGYPQKGVISATVIAPTGIDNDVLATSLCVLDPKEGTALIDSLGKKYASVIITKDREGRLVFHKSKTYRNFQINKH